MTEAKVTRVRDMAGRYEVSVNGAAVGCVVKDDYYQPVTWAAYLYREGRNSLPLGRDFTSRREAVSEVVIWNA